MTWQCSACGLVISYALDGDVHCCPVCKRPRRTTGDWSVQGNGFISSGEAKLARAVLIDGHWHLELYNRKKHEGVLIDLETLMKRLGMRG